MSEAPYCFLVCIIMKGSEMIENEFMHLIKKVKPCPYCGETVEMSRQNDGLWVLKCSDHLYVITTFASHEKEAKEAQSEDKGEE